ncbi:EF-hand domain-containing family member B-like, partial [Argonauta hians]
TKQEEVKISKREYCPHDLRSEDLTFNVLEADDPAQQQNLRRSKRRKGLIEECLIFPKMPETPTILEKFKTYYNPAMAEQRRHYGVANDPERYNSQKMIHGKIKKNNYPIKDFLSPPLKSHFQEVCDEVKEDLFIGKNLVELGKRSHRYKCEPEDINVELLTHGKPFEPTVDVYKVINPPVKQSEILAEEKAYHDMYVKSHVDYYPGERRSRKYDPPFRLTQTYGNPIINREDGRECKSTLDWDRMRKKRDPLISSILGDHLHYVHKKPGLTQTQIRDAKKFPDDHVFGRPGISSESAGSVIYDPSLLNCKDIKDHYGFLLALRKYLIDANYAKLTKILITMQQADRNNTGYLCADKVMEIMLVNNFPTHVEQLRTLLEMWSEPDKGVNYHLLMNCLNGKTSLPCHHLLPLDRCGKELEKSQLDCLQNKIKKDKVKLRFLKSSDAVDGVYKKNLISNDWRCYGITTIRRDLVLPKLQKFSCDKNYGNQERMQDLINPTVYDEYEVQMEMQQPRTYEELKEIYSKFDVNEETVRCIHSIATGGNLEQKVSLHDFQKLYGRPNEPAKWLGR